MMLKCYCCRAQIVDNGYYVTFHRSIILRDNQNNRMGGTTYRNLCATCATSLDSVITDRMFTLYYASPNNQEQLTSET